MSKEKISRRSYTKYAAAGVVIVAGAAAGGYYATRPTTEEKVKLNVITCEWPETVVFRDSIPQLYNEYTNGRVEIETEVLGYDQLAEKEVLELSNGSDTYDVIIHDCILLQHYIRSGWIEPLTSFLEDPNLPQPDFDKIMPWTTVYDQYNGEWYGLPLNANTQAVVINKELFQNAGLVDSEGNELVPKDWDEYTEFAKELTKGDIYGNVITEGGQDSGYSEWAYRIYSGKTPSGYDQHIIDLDNTWEVIFNQEGLGVRALSEVQKVIPYCPPGVLGFDYAEGNASFVGGNVGMWINWSDSFGNLENPDESKVAGKVGYHLPPLFADGKQTMCPGGWHVGINKYSKKKIEAFKLLAFLSADSRVQDAQIQAGTTAIWWKPYYEDPNMLKKFPGLAIYDEVVATGAKPEVAPFVLREFPEVQRVIWEEISLGLSEAKSLEDAMTTAESRTRQILTDSGYYD